MVTMTARPKAGSETKRACRVGQHQVGEKREGRGFSDGYELRNCREALVKAVGKGHRVEVGLQFENSLPSALIAPSVLCVQGLSTRMGVAGM